MKSVGVLALQGAVEEHLARLRSLGFHGAPVKRPDDLQSVAALIIPGGESTAISRLMRQNGLYEPVREFARQRPVMGTCAGLILCGSRIADGDGRVDPLGLVDMTVSRNGFGRQVDSFETTLEARGIGPDIQAVFIRAPYIESVGKGVAALASVEGRIVMAESGNVLVMSFHPELTDDDRVLRYFCRKIG